MRTLSSTDQSALRLRPGKQWNVDNGLAVVRFMDGRRITWMDQCGQFVHTFTTSVDHSPNDSPPIQNCPPSVIKRRFEFLNPTSIEINDSENELIIHTKSDVFHLVTEPVRLPLGDWKVTEISLAGIPEPADGSVFSVTPQYIRVMKQCREFYIVELIMFNKQIVGLNSGLNSDGCEALIPDTNIEKYVHLSQGLFISRFDDSTLILGGPDQSSAATQLTLTKTADYEEPPATPEPISEPPATEGFEATDTTPSP
jgi:hypothetical protein